MSIFPPFFCWGCPLLESRCASTFRPPFFLTSTFRKWVIFLPYSLFLCVSVPIFGKKGVLLNIPTSRPLFFFFEDSHFCDIWKSGRFFLSAPFPPPFFFFCRPLSPIIAHSLHWTTEMKTRKNPYLSIFFFKNMLTSYEELQVTSIRKARKFQNCLTRSLKQKLLEPAGAL